MSDSGGYDCEFLTDVVDDGEVRFEESVREQFGQDASQHGPHLPDAVVWPTATAEVAAVLGAAADRGVPVTPWSGGSGLEGNAVPVAGGVVLNIYRMDEVTVRQADLQVVVGPGVVYDDLNQELARHGLRFPPGISSGDVATIGGMIANNASGFNAVRYGETREHVLRLEAVLPDGRVVECGRDVIKTSSGYSLKDLLIGSEGTLGVVTEATLSLSGIPERKRAALVAFPTPTDACRAVSEVIRFGLRPGAIEFVDTESIRLINEFDDGAVFEPAPTLVIELHGNTSGIEEDADLVRSICEDNGATSWTGESEERMDRIWQARRDAYRAMRAYREDLDVALSGDVVVPISRYPDIVERIEEIAADLDVLCPCLGHAGDGNIHFSPIVDPGDTEAVARAHELNDRVVTAAIEMGGTATGEHGVGRGKRKFMREEHGAAVDVMAAVKRTLDPNGIMNPGKVLPDEDDPSTALRDRDGT